MSKVLVTGGAGFIGAHLVARLVDEGDEVVVFDNLRRGRTERIERILQRGGGRIVVGDVRRFDALAEVMRDCETVFHLAAQSNVMGAVTDPDYSVTTNVLGTFNVLRAAAEASVPRVVFASSREVYGDPRHLPVSEGQPLLAKNAYGASKVAGEAYCRAMARDGLRVEVVRLANVYGPGDSDRVIPLWLAAAQQARDLVVYGGEQVIDFLWVGKAVDALLFAARHGLPGPVNIGCGVGTRILDLADRVLRATRANSKVSRAPQREVEVAKLVADVSQMRSLGLAPDADPLGHLEEIVPFYATGGGES
ncbi:MAG: SDR family NAD(P)-dependent oxidoreductase [Polyangiaceae bacterium]